MTLEKINDYDGLKIHWAQKKQDSNVIYLLVEWENKFTRQNIVDLKFVFENTQYEFYMGLDSFERFEILANKDILVCVETPIFLVEYMPKYELKFCPVHRKWNLLCTK